MPNYEEIIQQSQANVNALALKLNELDELHADIKKLIKQPEIFDVKFGEVRDLAEKFITTIGGSVKIYLDGSNTLFIDKINEMAVKLSELDVQITRLVNTDFEELFKSLQIVFIEQTRKDLEIELKKIDEKTILFQDRINEFRAQIERLEKIDLEKHFDRLQKTLSEIYAAISSINLTLTALTQSLAEIAQQISSIQNLINKNHRDLKDSVSEVELKIIKHLGSQDIKTQELGERFEFMIKEMTIANTTIKKDLKIWKIITIAGFIICTALLFVLILKK